MRKQHKFTEKQDNIICTFVKLYRFNVAFGLHRASEYTGIKKSLIVSRYYRHLRNSREIFSVEFGDRVIWNTRAISKDELQSLSKYEKINKSQSFEKMDNRAWWKD